MIQADFVTYNNSLFHSFVNMFIEINSIKM